ncbi:MAG: RNA methyltransferase [Patescibacteria group bacterium]|nr:RNA methyltransferase [Patescibacteria group bacterium]
MTFVTLKKENRMLQYGMKQRTPERMEKIRRVAAVRQSGVVIIEDVVDPHNAEAAIRSCDAFGIQTVWFIFDTAPRFNPARVGRASSSSANKWLDYRIFDSTELCIKTLQGEGYQVIATVLDEGSESLYEADLLHPKPALLFGNEARGLSEKAIQLADRKLIIPMTGFVQSLNLSVTCSIFLFELNRQRRVAGLDRFLLPAAVRQGIAESFSER